MWYFFFSRLWNCSNSVVFFFSRFLNCFNRVVFLSLYILELFQHKSIFFSLDFGTVSTVWYFFSLDF
jgi:hypothetical protein